MLMTIFAPPGLHLVVMTPQWAEVDFISEASRALDHDITVLVGSIPQLHPEYSWQSDYVIDPSVLIDTLAARPGRSFAMPECHRATWLIEAVVTPCRGHPAAGAAASSSSPDASAGAASQRGLRPSL